MLTVEYISEEDWSKRHRDKRAEDGRPLLDHAVEAVRRRFGEAEFAWMGNLDLGDDLFGDARATRLPNSSHGLNSFTHLHNAALLSALNPPPAHFAFLELHRHRRRRRPHRALPAGHLPGRLPHLAPRSDRRHAEMHRRAGPRHRGLARGEIPGVPSRRHRRRARAGERQARQAAPARSPAMRDRQHREAERDRLLADVLALRKQELERQRGITPRQAGLQAERQHEPRPGKRDCKPSASTDSRRQARRQYRILVATKTL